MIAALCIAVYIAAWAHVSRRYYLWLGKEPSILDMPGAWVGAFYQGMIWPFSIPIFLIFRLFTPAHQRRLDITLWGKP